jgi:LysM repeat protein
LSSDAALPATHNGTQGACEPVTVQPGDTLVKLAAVHGTTLSGILSANPNMSISVALKAGDMLSIPCNGRTDSL